MSLSSRAGVAQRLILQPLRQWIDQAVGERTRLHALLVSLDWKQWLVLFAMGILIVSLEVRNHAIMWQEHRSNQTIWTDQELVVEIFIYGLLTPVLVGVIIGHMGRLAAERDKVARELQLRRERMRKISNSENWHELTEHVVTTPGTIIPAEHAWLFAQRSGAEEFEQVAHWERFGSEVVPSFTILSSAVCMRCLQEQSQAGSRLLECPHPDPASGGLAVNRYCLCLSGGMRKAALLFLVPHDRALAASEMRMLEELGSEMALAIDRASLHVLERNQDDITKKERMRIARDLHDTVGQNVTYLRLKLEQLNTSSLASNGAEFHDALANMLAVADETYAQMRNTLEALREQDHRPVEEVVRQYAIQSGERSGFDVRMHSTGPVSNLSPQQRRQVAYIAREALNNVEKHAHAQRVDIYLLWQDNELTLMVRDDGQGFDQAEYDGMSGYGIAIMGERSRAINANLVFTSAPGEGTEVTLNLPVKGHSSDNFATQ